jgi:hypothetical protein
MLPRTPGTRPQRPQPRPTGPNQVTALIQYLQSLRGRRLWPNEDPTLERPQPPSAAALASLVDHLLAALAFEPRLREEWCEVALEWALHCRGRHASSRSQQVGRGAGTGSRGGGGARANESSVVMGVRDAPLGVNGRDGERW